MNKNNGKNKNNEDKIHKREKKKPWHNFMRWETPEEADGGDTTIMIYYVKIYIYIYSYICECLFSSSCRKFLIYS